MTFDKILRIFHVEDDLVQTAMIQKIFTVEGTTVQLTQVQSFEEGLAKLQDDQDTYDLVLLDLFLPDAPGGTATFKRWMECCPQLPVVVFTSMDEQSAALECLAYGAQDYVLKDDARILPRICHYAVERWEHQKELSRTNARLAHLNRLYSSILDLTPDLIVRFKPDCQITYVNASVCKILSMNSDAIVGKCLIDFISYGRRSTDKCLGTLSPTSPISEPVESQLGDYWIAWTYAAIFNDNGEVVEFQAIGRDVTYKHQALTKLASDIKQQLENFQKSHSVLTDVLTSNFEKTDAALAVLKERIKENVDVSTRLD